MIQLQRPAEAETALAAAATAFEELGHRTLRGRVDLLRAELALNHGRAGEARNLALRALAMLHQRPVEAAAARRVLARVAMHAGRLDEAHADLAIGLAIADQLDLAPLRADLLFTRGLLHRLQGRLDDAVRDLSAAVEQVERLRGSLQAERFRAAFQGGHSAVYEGLVAALLVQATGPARARAFEVVEKAKSRALLDRMRGMLEPDGAEQPPAVNGEGDALMDESESRLLTEAARVRAELNALYSRFHDEHHPHSAGDETWRQAVRRREAELNDLENRLSATRGLGGFFAPTATLAQVRSMLGPDEGLVEFFALGDQLIGFVIDHRGVRGGRRLSPMSEVESALKRVQFQMNRALRPGALDGERGSRLVDDARRELQRLHELVMQPLRDELGDARRLIIVPHGVLHLAPFHALWDGREHLLERYEIRYAPSASLLLHVQQRRHEVRQAPDQSPRGSQALVVGVDDLLAPQIAREADEVASVLGCPAQRVLKAQQATIRRVRALAAEASIVHLACHGRFVADTPQGSGLKLADGWLTVRDICGLRLHADLVTLSGCETGLNQVQSGDELMGVLRGFFAAGAAAMLVSLWRVDDHATRWFMSRFYHELARRMREADEPGPAVVAGALRAAQVCMLEQWTHPALWAPFAVSGGTG